LTTLNTNDLRSRRLISEHLGDINTTHFAAQHNPKKTKEVEKKLTEIDIRLLAREDNFKFTAPSKEEINCK
jgi:hypothetical protein